MASHGIDPARIDAVRRFNRFYTREIGVLEEGLLHSDFTLAEARLLWELGQAATTATLLAGKMRVDEGYLSRMLRRFESRGLVTRTPGNRDRRQRRVALTARGRAAYRRIDAASRREIGAMLARLPTRSQRAVAGAMATIERTLAGDAATPVARLRTLRAGDWGFIVEQHGALYAREFGWDRRFEAMVARIVADIARDFDRKRERCWIAEIGGERVGSVCLVRQSHTVAKLRLLLLDPAARGYGLGRRLVHACTTFARSAGYHRIVLWTQRNLTAARRLYRQEGYRLVSSEPNREFGRGLVAENWALDLVR
ncbi:MAG TPA: bifunctional helix-turn-helix transcriptional regulator/GNAT family N-acetyltransferase [Casimicrobiaceae bacterium]|jgi:DNA-binding MarR family transcriptional regulator/ribosomal protein S18 acetylase RimI-like enzyme|nr:bifunctional helix-turn-helix transcriptional regulator/GNAT family N-acetyltransferase [Casimicrobiaceae bacterium]